MSTVRNTHGNGTAWILAVASMVRIVAVQIPSWIMEDPMTTKCDRCGGSKRVPCEHDRLGNCFEEFHGKCGYQDTADEHCTIPCPSCAEGNDAHDYDGTGDREPMGTRAFRPACTPEVTPEVGTGSGTNCVRGGDGICHAATGGSLPPVEFCKKQCSAYADGEMGYESRMRRDIERIRGDLHEQVVLLVEQVTTLTRALEERDRRWGELREIVVRHLRGCPNDETAKGVLREMDTIDRLDTPERETERTCTLECCGAIGIPGSIVCYCKHAYYDIGHMTTETDERGNVWLSTKGDGFKCSLGHDTSWVARDGCADFTPRGKETP